MEYKVTGKRYKTCTRKIATLYMDYSDSDSSDAKTFINDDAQKRYTKIFIAKTSTQNESLSLTWRKIILDILMRSSVS